MALSNVTPMFLTLGDGLITVPTCMVIEMSESIFISRGLAATKNSVLSSLRSTILLDIQFLISEIQLDKMEIAQSVSPGSRGSTRMYN